MNVVLLSPGFPYEMPFFARGLAEVGANVIGVGEQPEEALPPMARNALSRYLQVDSLWDEPAVVKELRRFAAEAPVDRVECLWEPGVVLAARIREALELPGMRVEQATAFRDKEVMKGILDRAGIRTPRHRRASTERECRQAAEEIGYPLIVKPIAGAGSADTHRIDDPGELESTLPSVRHVAEVSVEEFIEGEEFTFDTICTGGRISYYNVSWYRPCPLVGRSIEWVSPQTVSLRKPETPPLLSGIEMGRAVLKALDFDSGFTHMEWFRTAAGEAVFGEIAARPPGALSVPIMNLSADVDSYVGWAEAVCHGRFGQPIERRHNAAVIFKRAQGQGRITRVEGLERLVARYRSHIVEVELLPVGSPRRNWKQTLLSDGHVIVRHPDLEATMEIADRFGTDLQLYAG
jgi:hypothetical protein